MNKTEVTEALAFPKHPWQTEGTRNWQHLPDCFLAVAAC